MPIMKCQIEGKTGFKYGESGHCYTGPGAREKAKKQGQAIEISKHKPKAEQHNIFRKVIEIVAAWRNKDE